MVTTLPPPTPSPSTSKSYLSALVEKPLLSLPSISVPISNLPPPHPSSPQTIFNPPQHVHELQNRLSVTSVVPNPSSVILSTDTLNRIRAPWKLAVIVKCYGKKLGYQFFCFKIRQLWPTKSIMDVIDLGDDFFIVRFSLEDEFNKAVQEGPWFINGYFLAVRLWEPDFHTEKAITKTAAIWVRLPGLPVEYYDAIVLQQVGASLGSLLRVDTKTSSSERGRYARLCIQFDLGSQVQTHVTIGNHQQLVQYENVTICYNCGFLGHDLLNCPHPKPTPCLPVEPLLALDIGLAANLGVKPASDPYGEWLIVSKRKKLGYPPPANPLAKTRQSSARISQNHNVVSNYGIPSYRVSHHQLRPAAETSWKAKVVLDKPLVKVVHNTLPGNFSPVTTSFSAYSGAGSFNQCTTDVPPILDATLATESCNNSLRFDIPPSTLSKAQPIALTIPTISTSEPPGCTPGPKESVEVQAACPKSRIELVPRLAILSPGELNLKKCLAKLNGNSNLVDGGYNGSAYPSGTFLPNSSTRTSLRNLKAAARAVNRGRSDCGDELRKSLKLCLEPTLPRICGGNQVVLQSQRSGDASDSNM